MSLAEFRPPEKQFYVIRQRDSVRGNVGLLNLILRNTRPHHARRPGAALYPGLERAFQASPGSFVRVFEAALFKDQRTVCPSKEVTSSVAETGTVIPAEGVPGAPL